MHSRVRRAIAALITAVVAVLGVGLVPSEAATVYKRCYPTPTGPAPAWSNTPLGVSSWTDAYKKTWHWRINDFWEVYNSPDIWHDAMGVYMNGTRIRDVYTGARYLEGVQYSYNRTLKRSFGGKWKRNTWWGNYNVYCNTYSQ